MPVSCECCVGSQNSLPRSDPSSRGVLQSICVSLSVTKFKVTHYTYSEWEDRGQNKNENNTNSEVGLVQCLI